MNLKKLLAETLGTSWLVLGWCGAAVLAAAFPEVGIGLHGVSLAFGLAAAGQHPKNEVLPYIVAQVIGGIIGAGILYLIASGKAGFDVVASGFAANGYGEHASGGYSMLSGVITEVVATAFFLFIILGATDKKAPAGFAPLAIGLGLTLIHLVTIPVTNTSVNPARSLGPAVFVGGWALQQVWLFWVGPIVGAIIGAFAYKVVHSLCIQKNNFE